MSGHLRELIKNGILNHDRINEIASQLSDAIQVYDANGNLLYCNEASIKMDDISYAASRGKHLTHVYPSIAVAESTILKVLKTGKPIYNNEQIYSNYKGRNLATINTTLPINSGSSVVGAIEISRNLTEYRDLSQKVIELESRFSSKREPLAGKQKTYNFDDIITTNIEFIRLKSVAKKAAKTNIPVLIYGDTGTGKELLAHSIHNASMRSRENFLVQNCAALPTNLLEGILFGTSKGGFTGAVNRPGLFELAHGGSIFLDEINSMPLELQAKLLRVLQNGSFRRVGDTKERTADLRIIAATNVDPNMAIRDGSLRRDLYYRLNTVLLWIPSLSERREDIEYLTDFFIKKYSNQLGKDTADISEDVRKLFNVYPWDGNVRELEHVIEATVSLNDTQCIDIIHLPHNLRYFYSENLVKKKYSVSAASGLVDAVVDLEISMIREALSSGNKNVSLAASILGIPRQTLQYKIKKYGLGE